MPWSKLLEMLFCVTEVFALPFGLIVFVIERRKQRQNEYEELYQRLLTSTRASRSWCPTTLTFNFLAGRGLSPLLRSFRE